MKHPSRTVSRTVTTAVALFAVVAIGVGIAAAESAVLVLADGTELVGRSVELRDGTYRLTMADDAVVAIPAGLVTELRLAGGTDEAPPDEAAPAATDSDAPTDEAAPELPDGFDTTGPRTLAGYPRDRLTPSQAEQVRAFGRPPARYPRNVVDPYWRPSSDWDNSLENNNFAPSRWSRSVIDPIWRPTTGYRWGDPFSDRRANFRPSVVDWRWRPSDGFSSGARGFTLFDDDVFEPESAESGAQAP